MAPSDQVKLTPAGAASLCLFKVGEEAGPLGAKAGGSEVGSEITQPDALFTLLSLVALPLFEWWPKKCTLLWAGH